MGSIGSFLQVAVWHASVGDANETLRAAAVSSVFFTALCVNISLCTLRYLDAQPQLRSRRHFTCFVRWNPCEGRQRPQLVFYPPIPNAPLSDAKILKPMTAVGIKLVLPMLVHQMRCHRGTVKNLRGPAW
jgi:hypothetical protein